MEDSESVVRELQDLIDRLTMSHGASLASVLVTFENGNQVELHSNAEIKPN